MPDVIEDLIKTQRERDLLEAEVRYYRAVSSMVPEDVPVDLQLRSLRVLLKPPPFDRTTQG